MQDCTVFARVAAFLSAFLPRKETDVKSQVCQSRNIPADLLLEASFTNDTEVRPNSGLTLCSINVELLVC